jgi:hypothetical protein
MEKLANTFDEPLSKHQKKFRPKKSYPFQKSPTAEKTEKDALRRHLHWGDFADLVKRFCQPCEAISPIEKQFVKRFFPLFMKRFFR